jgi:hypothetical protein
MVMITGGDGGIRTLDRPLQAYNGLANRRLQPLGHVSSSVDMPDARASRKRQIQGISDCASIGGPRSEYAVDNAYTRLDRIMPSPRPDRNSNFSYFNEL